MSKSSQNENSSHTQPHTGETPYTCDVCDKSFGKNCNLKKHKRIHTSDKLFPCDLCDKSFFYRNSLKYHKSTHTGEKSFPCGLCDKSFCYPTSLKAHMHTHTGEKAFSCNLCDKKFGYRSSLTKHMRTHTAGKKQISSGECEKPFSQSSDSKNDETKQQPDKKAKQHSDVDEEIRSRFENLVNFILSLK